MAAHDAAGGSVHGASHVVASNNFLIPNGTFIVEFVLFLLVLLVLAKFVLPSIQRPLREREAMLRKQIEDTEQARRRLDEAQRSYQDALIEARTEASQIREDARVKAQQAIDERRAVAREEYERIVARGEAQLAGQREAIVRELRAEIGTLAVELSEKIVQQPLADDPQVAVTVEAFLAGTAADARVQQGVQA